MKYQIKDVIHFYFGQDVDISGTEYGKIEIEKNRLKYVKLKGISTISGEVRAQLETNLKQHNDGLMYLDISVIKLLLRPLYDMTDEEGKYCAILLWYKDEEEFNKESIIIQARQIKRAIIDIQDNYGGISLASYKIGFELFTYLLKQGFDLFGLIQTNQVIDKTPILKMKLKYLLND